MQVAKPRLRGHFHQAMFFISLGASSLLISITNSKIKSISAVIYSLGLLLMFGISALYHRINWPPEKRIILKRLDHACIYTMIAGSFTPICLLAMPEQSGKNLLIIIWIIALLGIMQSVFFVNIPKLASSIVYIIMGLIIVPYVKSLSQSIGPNYTWLLIAGGLAYAIGALAYGFKRPAFKPDVFGYHEFFHIMVSLGATLHFILIYTLIRY